MEDLSGLENFLLNMLALAGSTKRIVGGKDMAFGLSRASNDALRSLTVGLLGIQCITGKNWCRM